MHAPLVMSQPLPDSRRNQSASSALLANTVQPLHQSLILLPVPQASTAMRMCLPQAHLLQDEGASPVNTVLKAPSALQNVHQGRQERLKPHFRPQLEVELQFVPQQLLVLPALLAATAQPTAWLMAHLVLLALVPAQVVMCA